MFRSRIFFTALPLILVAGCSPDDLEAPAEAEATGATGAADTAGAAGAPADADAVLAEVVSAMGMEDVDALSYSGSAWRIRNSFRQTLSASPPWEWRDDISNYTRTIDLAAPASLATGETFAQGMFLTPPEAGTYTQSIGAGQDAWDQQLEIWLTPWGFVQGAQDNGVEIDEAAAEGDYTVLSWNSPAGQTSPSGMRYTVRGYINGDNLVERVETWVEDPFMGDLHIEGVYSDYREIDGLMVPANMEQRRAGGGVFGVAVSDAMANPDDLEEVLAQAPAPRGGPGGGGGGGGGQVPAADLAQQLDEGVYLIGGGYVSLAVEFADHIVVFEGGQSEARGEQVIAEVQRLFPDKPIGFVVNSHPHSDHTAGLVPFVREGATIVTHADNVEFLDMALSTPRTLLGEETLDPQFQAVEGVGVLEDETMRFELHHIPNQHSDGMLVGLLPEQGILFQADFTLPAPGADPNPFVVNLAEYVSENDLDFERYLAVHAAQAPQTREDLLAAIGQ